MEHIGKDRTESPFREENQGRNIVHNQIDKHELEGAKADVGIKSKFFKRSSTR